MIKSLLGECCCHFPGWPLDPSHIAAFSYLLDEHRHAQQPQDLCNKDSEASISLDPCREGWNTALLTEPLVHTKWMYSTVFNQSLHGHLDYTLIFHLPYSSVLKDHEIVNELLFPILLDQDVYLVQNKSDRNLKLACDGWWISGLRLLCYRWRHYWNLTLHTASTVLEQSGSKLTPSVELIMLLCGALDNRSIRMLEMSCGKKGGWVHIWHSLRA